MPLIISPVFICDADIFFIHSFPKPPDAELSYFQDSRQFSCSECRVRGFFLYIEQIPLTSVIVFFLPDTEKKKIRIRMSWNVIPKIRYLWSVLFIFIVFSPRVTL